MLYRIVEVKSWFWQRRFLHHNCLRNSSILMGPLTEGTELIYITLSSYVEISFVPCVGGPMNIDLIFRHEENFTMSSLRHRRP